MILFCFFSSLAPWSITPVPQKKKQKYHLHFPKNGGDKRVICAPYVPWWFPKWRKIIIAHFLLGKHMWSPFLKRDVFFFFFFHRHLWRNLTPPDILFHKWSWLEVGAGPDRAWLTSWLPANSGIHKSPLLCFPKKSDTPDVVPSPIGLQTLSKHEWKKIDGKTNV